MSTIHCESTSLASPRHGALVVGFGMAVAMWSLGYAGRLPAIRLPGPVLLGLLLACLVAGGMVLGRYGGTSWRGGALAGLVAGAINLLVLGSFLSGSQPNQIVPAAWIWVPGSILTAALLAAVGSLAGRSNWLRREPPFRRWPVAFVWVAAVAALLLLAVGGVVTSTGTGLAVVDWPNSFGYNMFLYPFSRMTGGIYYEHAHRLFGALVGLTTLVLALLLHRTEERRWVRALGWSALGLVIVQGILGGLRVTGQFTLSSTATMHPSQALAVVHGVVGQLFLALLVALGVVVSDAWRRATPARSQRESARAERLLSAAFFAAMLCQLVLGAAQRHLDRFLVFHVLTGVAVVAPLALHLGFRQLGLQSRAPLLKRLGLSLVLAVSLQILLGVSAFTLGRGLDAGAPWEGLEVAVATAHQWFGAVLLALAVVFLCFSFRPVGAPGPSETRP